MSNYKENKNAKIFGTFEGVFTPTILTIFGVVMYLRLGWVLANVGIFATVLIVTMSIAIILITVLSISATATNMNIGVGGAYFIISRSLGLEAGAAIGIPLYLAQSLGISFYIAGFAESLNNIFPYIPVQIIGFLSLTILTVVSYLSTGLALKIQFFVMLIIIFSLISLFIGNDIQYNFSEYKDVFTTQSFWVVFAVFFPAVTGIEAGLSMSGNLKKPSISLPLGSLSAVFIAYIVYLIIPIYLYNVVPQKLLFEDPLIMTKVAYIGELIILGIWSASLSSALGAILGAPRTLQALSRDNLVPKFIGRGFGREDIPRIATFITFLIAGTGILLGDINIIAPILSMFFLTSYGFLNFSSGIEGMIGNPSWRPRFSIPWWVSLIGSALCFATMFMINPGATIIAIILTISVYYYVQRKKLHISWGDMRRGILMQLLKFAVTKISSLPDNHKSWRPHILVLSGSPTTRWYLLELSYAMTSVRGLMTTATIIPSSSSQINRIDDIESHIKSYLNKKGLMSLVKVTEDDSVIHGAKSLIRNYGLGDISPNTVILGETEKEDNFDEFAEMLIRVYQMKKNIIIVRKSKYDECSLLKNLKNIDIWWGRQRDNAALSLALGVMIQRFSNKVKHLNLNLKSIISDGDSVSALKLLENYVSMSRIKAKCYVYLESGEKEEVFNRMLKESKDVQLTFIGMKPPDMKKFLKSPTSVIESYRNYYLSLLKMTKDFPTTAIVIAAEDTDFHKIFIH